MIRLLLSRRRGFAPRSSDVAVPEPILFRERLVIAGRRYVRYSGPGVPPMTVSAGDEVTVQIIVDGRELTGE